MSRAFGSVIGAYVADAAGSYVEFMRKINITEKLVKEALELNGGGPFRLGPGQMTDDSEMAMCILHGLIPENLPKIRKCDVDTDPYLPKGLSLDISGVQEYFGKWVSSGPFDIGMTTRTAL